MTVRTKEHLAIDLSTGNSRNDKIETKFMVDLLDSVALEAEVATDLEDYQLAEGPFVLPTYTVGTVPANQSAGTLIYLSDGTLPLAVFDGTDWLYADGTTVGA